MDKTKNARLEFATEEKSSVIIKTLLDLFSIRVNLCSSVAN